MIQAKWPLDKWEAGVEFFLDVGGIGYREPDGSIWFSLVGGRRVKLLPPQMLKIIAASGGQLPGWQLSLPDDWLDNPRRNVQAGQKRPIEVMRAFRDVLHPVDDLYSSLTAAANALTAKALRSRADELRSGKPLGAVSAFDLPVAKRAFSRDQFLSNKLAECRDDIARGKNPKKLRLVHAKRLEFMAEMAGTRVNGQLLHLMPALATCFQRIFDLEAARRWEGPDASRPAGPFPPFASALLLELGISYAPSSIHSNLGKWIAQQNADKPRF
jgi:hypothetical protein